MPEIRTRYALFLLIAVGILVLIPTLLVPIPPLLDYPNHLARLWLVAGGADTAPASQFYAVNWHGITTNIAIDLMAAGLSACIPPLLLGRILLGLAVILPPLGGVLLSRALFRVWHPWQILFFFFWCTQTLLAGFLNFQLGLGLALLAATLDCYLNRRHSPGIACTLRVATAALLLLVHPFALLFYIALLAGLDFGAGHRCAEPLWPRLKTVLRRAGFALLPVFVLILAQRTVPGVDANAPFNIVFTPFPYSLLAAFSPFIGYDNTIDMALAALFLLVALYLLHGQNQRIHYGLMCVAFLVFLTSLCMPINLGQTSWIDRRLPIMAVLGILAAILPEPARKPSRAGIILPILLCLVIVGLRTLWTGWNWYAGVEMTRSVEDALSAMPPGARMLPLQYNNTPATTKNDRTLSAARGRTLAYINESYRNYPVLAIIWRHAFVPQLFSQPGKQPITVRPPYDTLSTRWGGTIPTVGELTSPATITDEHAYVRHWRSAFDYALILSADQKGSQTTPPLPPEFHLIKDAGFAQLYRITGRK